MNRWFLTAAAGALLLAGGFVSPAMAQQAFTIGGLFSTPVSGAGNQILTGGAGFTASVYKPLQGDRLWQTVFVLGFDYIHLDARDGVNFNAATGQNQIIDGADLVWLRPGLGWRFGGKRINVFTDVTGIVGYGSTSFSPNPRGFDPTETQFTVGSFVDHSFQGGFSVSGGLQFQVFGGRMAKVGISYNEVFTTLFTAVQRDDAFVNAFLEIHFGPPIYTDHH